MPQRLVLMAMFMALVGRGAEGSFFLPKNPVAAAYMLQRLSQDELIAAPRSEFVYVALLERKGLDRKYRREALQGLARIRNTNPLTELLRGVSDLDKQGEGAAVAVQELSPLLLEFKKETLATNSASLETLAHSAILPITRQLGFAGLISGQRDVQVLWNQAEGQQRVDLVYATELLGDPKLKEALYPPLSALIKRPDEPDLQRAAISALPSFPGHEASTFQLLAELVQGGNELELAMRSLQKIPKKTWPQDRVAPLLKSIVSHLETVPASERSQTNIVDVVQLATELASVLPVAEARTIVKRLRDFGVRVVVIRTLPEQMLYDTQTVVAEAGKPIEMILINDDVMPHNLVVVAPGAVAEIGTAAEKMPSEPDAQGRLYVPDSPKVLHATKMLLSGERAKLSFTAPTDVGDYQYVCTFPGHWLRMVGTLAVVRDVDEYLAQHPTTEPAITLWQPSDFPPATAEDAARRNMASGKKLFVTLACAQCHKINGEGYAYGPDLTDVFVRLKKSREALVTALIEPSREIADRYRNYLFERADGETTTGLVVEEAPASLTIHAGPSDALLQTIPKAEIGSRTPQSLSVMPAGLLSTLTKDQVLDLLAFLEAGGKGVPHEHAH